MKTARLLLLTMLLGAGAEAAPLLALAKQPRRARPKPAAAKPAPETPAPAAIPGVPLEDPYNLFHMMAVPELPAPAPKRSVLPRPPGPVPPRPLRK